MTRFVLALTALRKSGTGENLRGGAGRRVADELGVHSASIMDGSSALGAVWGYRGAGDLSEAW